MVAAVEEADDITIERSIPRSHRGRRPTGFWPRGSTEMISARSVTSRDDRRPGKAQYERRAAPDGRALRVSLRVGDPAQTSEMFTALLAAVAARTFDVVGHLLVVGEAGEARPLEQRRCGRTTSLPPVSGRRWKSEIVLCIGEALNIVRLWLLAHVMSTSTYMSVPCTNRQPRLGRSWVR